jgi:hypothetical protein
VISCMAVSSGLLDLGRIQARWVLGPATDDTTPTRVMALREMVSSWSKIAPVRQEYDYTLV